MPPPFPATAQALRTVPLSHERARAWVHREIEHTRAAQVQDVRTMQNYNAIDNENQETIKAVRDAKTLRRTALDALAAGDQATLGTALLALGTVLDAAESHVDRSSGLVAKGRLIEGEDVTRNRERVHENDIKIAHLRRRQPDWRPGGDDGPGAA